MKKQFIILSLTSLFVIQCGTPQRSQTTYKGSLSGQGSSFSLPFTSELFKKFTADSKIQIEYTSDSSYKGIEALLNGTVDFAISTVPLTDQELAKHTDILHIPVAAAGINFAYNIPQKGFGLQDDPVYLTPDILAKIFTQKITKWNDPEIIALNKKVSETPNRVFPDLDITLIQREDNSGDTYVLTSFFTKALKNWKLGRTSLLPTYQKNNIQKASTLDMMITLAQTPGSITYTTMIYGIQNNIPLARIKNNQGVYGRGCNFRTLEAMKVNETNSDNRVDLTYPNKGQEVGVSTAFIYLLVKQEQNYNNRTQEQAQQTVDFINWLLLPVAQRQLEPLFFANLTPKFRVAAQKTLAKMTYNGTPLIPTKITTKKK